MESDEDLVQKLRNEFPEQFLSLVKMHLSFCLDQATDEVDCTTPQKLGEKRSNTTSKKNKIPKQQPSEGVKYFSQINLLIDHLSKPSSLMQEGLFRRNGKIKQQQELMTFTKEKSVAEMTTILDSGAYSVHEVATVLKNLLSEMPEPLLIEGYYPLHCSLAKLNHSKRQVRGCQMLVLLLPNENAAILRRLLNMLHEVSLHQDENKMNAMNLGIVLAPHILCPRKMSAEDLTTNASSLAHIVSFMIENAKVLFDYPQEFMSDVKLQLKRDTEEEDSSSTSSTPPVKTTITFVDREMTAKVVAEVGLDPTEAALAELYAYVQSQPESEVKKKWVHKFNKENGCGTPKVILNSSLSDACAKNCKNLSQSIRKHLFNGGGVTPKRRRSKSSSRTHALCYSGEASPPYPETSILSDDGKSPSIKGARARTATDRSVLESTPTSRRDYIRHPAYKTPLRTANTNLLSSVPSDLAKENAIHQEQVISPLTQSAQRFPFYVRDSIMTPRCRKPVFTFSPIDEPADDIVPNSDSIQLANIAQPPAESKVADEAPAVELPNAEETPISPDACSDAASSEATSTEPTCSEPTCSEEPTCSDLACSEPTCSELACSEPSCSEAACSEPACSDLACSEAEKDMSDADVLEESSSSDGSDDSIISGCALIQESRTSLTSPFKKYLISREMQVCDSSRDQTQSEPSTSVDPILLDSNSQLSESMLEFLDGNAQDSTGRPRSSPTRPSPPLTKSILFETSL